MTQEKVNAAGWKLENSYAELPKAFFSLIQVNPVESPEMIVLNHSLAESLGLNARALESGEGVKVFAGNEVPEGSVPLAQAYAGHQFGNFTMLGDGRALMIGEQITPDGERFDIQLKGSGRTPYSRGGDGRAALGPMLREYIISEAMHGLGIPTTRSLAVVTTGEPVYRETQLTGAVMTRVAASHLRVGTFEYGANFTEKENLQALADYAIERHYPEIKKDKNPYISLLREVQKRQAALIAKWQMIGFIHGVMNTDNMTISGETIDYGPCAFMDTYNPATVFSSIDVQGRYAYGNQPPIAGWNITRFAEALLPLFHDNQEKAIELAQDVLSDYPLAFNIAWVKGMRCKLGLFNEEEADEALILDLLKIMNKEKADYTNTFRALTLDDRKFSLFVYQDFQEWEKRWQERRTRQPESDKESKDLMCKHNPAIIPRNHRVEEALLAAEEGDLSVMEKLVSVMKNPFAYSDEQEEYSAPPPPSEAINYQTFCGT
ncbi:protein adenylyltransferase SelO [Fictibacillus fluitans]|uniref:Protein nucleotidyltransferase YdiU n=1 Tax=Fictibacillus fluitans TaxID=3058422 RepID=A0ABT8I065_9BACL|nr:YdiU family protein [Fictibacillus sp. NE201]MDN4526390.1 YdiU family protein [Fictibacillus sp. NE201]